jgi:rubrerythrin
MTFTRTVEDFTCEHCGVTTRGNGYTNHCPQCLWSKHVDISPGDRAEACQGLMRPDGLEGSTPEYTLIHRCERCGAIRRVRSSPNDDPDALLALAREQAAR